MASRLAQLAISARTVQPSPFRAGGSPQLSDALDAIVCRSFGVAPQASEAVLDKRAETITPTEEAAIDAAQNTVNNLNTAAALKEVRTVPDGRIKEACFQERNLSS